MSDNVNDNIKAADIHAEDIGLTLIMIHAARGCMYHYHAGHIYYGQGSCKLSSPTVELSLTLSVSVSVSASDWFRLQASRANQA